MEMSRRSKLREEAFKVGESGDVDWKTAQTMDLDFYLEEAREGAFGG